MQGIMSSLINIGAVAAFLIAPMLQGRVKKTTMLLFGACILVLSFFLLGAGRVLENQLLIDIQARLRSGRGEGYRRWATTFNLKQMARTVAYLQEHNLMDASVLSARADEAAARCHALSGQIQAAEKHLAETAVLKRHIVNYARTREVYAAYRKSGYSAKYRQEHEDEIALHRTAKQAFDALGVQKLPSVKSLNAQYARLLGEKKAAYAEYRAAREEMRELMVHRKNLALILQGDAKEGKGKEAEREGR